MAVRLGRKAGADDLRSGDDDPLVHRVDEVCPLLRDIGSLDRIPEGAKPRNDAIGSDRLPFEHREADGEACHKDAERRGNSPAIFPCELACQVSGDEQPSDRSDPNCGAIAVLQVAEQVLREAPDLLEAQTRREGGDGDESSCSRLPR